MSAVKAPLRVIPPLSEPPLDTSQGEPIATAGFRVRGVGEHPELNSVLSSNVGSIQSSFEEQVSFKLDSSQFATESRIFSIEGTGILPPEDQHE